MTLAKAFENFLFGLCFGMGFCVAQSVLAFIVSLLSHPGVPVH
jgi:hypothetical protein